MGRTRSTTTFIVEPKKGVMTEILETVLEFGFHKLQLNRIVGDIFAGNKGSKKLMEKFGFQKEGVLRQTDFDGLHYHDTVVYSMLKPEYEEKMQQVPENSWLK
ncbi:GNAT family N-acetyltransferase [Oceanobacillus kapialis]|uniref:GNAT family N-acetyltransferase n=1 Tax=Oceanobacillus kapialis TaxID=481353 RepID=UPI00384DAEBB